MKYLYQGLVPMPEVIIYDNGCNLHEYMLNRDPRLFKNTMLHSDGMHVEGHEDCAETYNPNFYRMLEGCIFILT
jgi:hypothetical protein